MGPSSKNALKITVSHNNDAPSAQGGASGPGWQPAAYYNIQKKIDKQYKAFFIWDKHSHLAICLRLVEPHSQTTDSYMIVYIFTLIENHFKCHSMA